MGLPGTFRGRARKAAQLRAAKREIGCPSVRAARGRAVAARLRRKNFKNRARCASWAGGWGLEGVGGGVGVGVGWVGGWVGRGGRGLHI
jgi:hypothetical protein